ncbi:MAG TPA: hypothetical protein VF870_16430, partial [Ignavibacteriaceae bacterium]
ILTVSSCQKYEIFPSTGYEEVTLKNLTGLDGCGFVFQKVDNKYLEATNMKNFINTYVDGQKYWIKYKIASDAASICMVGDIIEIVRLRDRP